MRNILAANKNVRAFVLIVLITIVGCSKDNPAPVTPVQSPKAITSFDFKDLLTIVRGTIIESVENTITLRISYDVPLNALVPTITFAGESVTPASGIPQDFSQPVLYIVKASDGSTAVYKVIVLLYSPSPNTGYHWGLTNGIDRNVLSIAANKKNIYAGTEAGIFRSYNYEKWINMGLASSSINSLAASGNSLFAGTDNGIYVSLDSANTWTSSNTGLGNQNVLSLAVSGDLIYAGTKAGAYLSSNNGDSWGLITDGFISGLSVFCIIVDGSNVFIGTDDGVFVTSDGGSNWQHVGFVNMTITSLLATNNNIFAGSSGLNTGGAVSLSPDEGTTWTYMNNGLVSGQHIYSLVFRDTSIYAGTAFGPYMSSNSGGVWVGIGLVFVPVFSILANGNGLFAGTANGVYFSPI